VSSVEEEAIIVAFRRHTSSSSDDCSYASQATISHSTRSSSHRCFQRHDVSRSPEVEGDKPKRSKFRSYPIGYFHIDIAEVRTEQAEDVTDTSDLALAASDCDHATVSHKSRLLSDNGPSYIAAESAEYIEANKMSHVRGAPCHPQT
ncbi:hypothetical protein OY671_010599, partial [Metschnikowia pulcherrima]